MTPLVLKKGGIEITVDTEMRCFEYMTDESTWVVAWSISDARSYLEKNMGTDTDGADWKECDYFDYIKVNKVPTGTETRCRHYKDGLPLVQIYECLADRPEDETGILATTV